MSTTTMTGINTAQHIMQSLNSPVRADEDNEDNLIDPEAVDELREIEMRMVRQVYVERSLSLVAGSFFPSAKSEAGSGSGSREWNETNPDSPLNISSLFPSNKSETDSSPEFSRSNSDSMKPIFLPATSPIDSPENYEIIVRSRSIPSYSIMSIFPPAMSEIDSPDNYEIIFRNPSIPSYYHFFPPDMSDTDSYGSSTPNHQLSIPSYYHCFPPDRSDTDSYRSSTPNQLSIPSLYVPPNKSETINSSLVINGISLDERILGGIVGIDSLDEKIKKCIQAVKILRSKSVYDLMFTCTDSDLEIHFNKALLNFREAVALGGISPENLFRILDTYDVMAKVRLKATILDNLEINQARAMLTGKTQTPTDLEHKQNRILKKLMQSSHIHPLTETMMNYVKLIVDDDQLDALRNHDSNSLKMNPLASQLLELINLLEFSFEKESKFYGKGGLQYIFLMNNILYIDQKVKDLDLGGLLGDNWDRKQHKQTRQYAMSYLRASWTKVLDCLNDRGIPRSSSSKASTVALQKRLKKFNTCFEKIYRVQTAWKVPDAQLREELRTSILEMVIPAYHSFMGRFGNQVESGRHAEKYIEYTADDLESYLFNLFEGVPQVLHRRRRKVHRKVQRIKQDSHEGLELRTLVSIKPPVMGRVKRVLIQFNKA